MSTTATVNTSSSRPGTWGREDEDHQARMELLESLPVRLQDAILERIVQLAAEGKTLAASAWAVRLDPLVVEMELRRAQERDERPLPLTDEQQRDDEQREELPQLDQLDMNRLAKGTHVANYPLRLMIAEAQAADPHLTLSAIFSAAGYSGSSHGSRHLGLMRNSGCARYGQTITPVNAARIVRALGRDPREVPG